MVSRGMINFGKGFTQESIPEAIEQIYQDVWSKYNSDKYKDKSIMDIIEESKNDILQSGWFGGMVGGVVHPIAHIKDTLGKPIQEFNQHNAKQDLQQTISMVKFAPKDKKVEIYQNATRQLDTLEQTFNNIKDLYQNKPMSIDEINNKLDNLDIASKQVLVENIAKSLPDIVGSSTNEELINKVKEITDKLKEYKQAENSEIKQQLFNNIVNDVKGVLNVIKQDTTLTENQKQNIINHIHNTLKNDIKNNIIPAIKNKAQSS
jgi:hypothetical protein